MMTDEKLDQILKQALSPSVSDQDVRIKPSERLEEVKMKKFHVKRVAVAAAVACVLLGTTAYAASNWENVTTLMSSGGDTSYDSFDKKAKAEKKAGFAVDAVESFSNGYSFEEFEVVDTVGIDDNNNEQMKYKNLNAVYTNEAGNRLMMFAFESKYGVDNPEGLPKPAQSYVVDGVEVNYYVYHYKFVQADYELTPEDIENEKDPSYFISYGSDKVEEKEMANIDWEKDGIKYSILDSGANETPESLLSMVEELLK